MMNPILGAVPKVASSSLKRSFHCMATQQSGSELPQSKTVAVIGAGAAGMVAARELQRENHAVTVFEQSERSGGVWVYSDEVEAEDLTGQKNDRKRIHGSMYRSLRTNLPRHIMAYTDVPFTLTGSDDDRLYCGHQEVLRYLEKFEKAFGISSVTRFRHKVLGLTPIEGKRQLDNSIGPRWQLRVKDLEHEAELAESFDAVVVCNGHYSKPRVPDIPGMDSFPGKQLHTHNFRTNGEFKGKNCVVMGASASGQDIAREVADVARKVYFSARSMKFGSKQIEWQSSDETFGCCHNMLRRAAISHLSADGTVFFADGWRAEDVDVVIYATGYHYSFPFLQDSAVITVQDNSCWAMHPHDVDGGRVLSWATQKHISGAQDPAPCRIDPLYQHAICSSHPSLSFIGIPWQVIPFPMMELQAKWIANLLSGKCRLPSRKDMESHTRKFHEERTAQGVPVRYSHRLGEQQWDYNAWLADQVSLGSRLEPWRTEMHKAGQSNIKEHPDSYRDSFPDPKLVAKAEADGRALTLGPQQKSIAC